MASIISIVHSRWYQYFDQFQYSTQDFYTQVEEIITARNVPDTKLSRVKFFQDKKFWTKREYLRITHDEYIFDICAAPYADGFFVSFWLGESPSWLYRLIIKIPFIGQFIEVFVESKTYYQHDTATMFQECIKSCIKTAIENITNEKGVRLTFDNTRFSESIPSFGTRR